MLIKDIMQSVKIHTISKDATVKEASVLMAELNIGALLVGTPAKIEGLFSERDLLKKVAAMELPVESTKLKDVMSTSIIVVEDNEMAVFALKIMVEKKFRHLPVINEKGLCVGMVGIRDLMKAVTRNFEKENKGLARHIIENKKLPELLK